ncbi:MAG: aminopeptidase P family N-terminal domain-containing protein, partial [Clostridiaceae bacterium]
MSRIARIKESMTKNNVDALIVTDPSNIFYLTGKWIHPGERLLALVLRQD